MLKDNNPAWTTGLPRNGSGPPTPKRERPNNLQTKTGGNQAGALRVQYRAIFRRSYACNKLLGSRDFGHMDIVHLCAFRRYWYSHLIFLSWCVVKVLQPFLPSFWSQWEIINITYFWGTALLIFIESKMNEPLWSVMSLRQTSSTYKSRKLSVTGKSRLQPYSASVCFETFLVNVVKDRVLVESLLIILQLLPIIKGSFIEWWKREETVVQVLPCIGILFRASGPCSWYWIASKIIHH